MRVLKDGVWLDERDPGRRPSTDKAFTVWEAVQHLEHVLAGSGHPGVGALRFSLSLAADALVIPLMFLAMGLMAANKVQGLALAKVLNILCLSPLLLAAVPDRLSWIVAVVPGAWGSVIRLGASAPLRGDSYKNLDEEHRDAVETKPRRCGA